MFNHKLELFFNQFPIIKKIYVGFSGGLDSTVLLHALAQTSLKSSLEAIHVNHGLSQNALAWEAHCYDYCNRLNLSMRVHKIHIDKQNSQSLEAIARDKRYHVFANILQTNDLLCTAHHQDDQAETLLLQLFRGTGVRGLSGMPAVKKFHQGWLVRPLLGVSRHQLLEYAKQYGLTWINDESNFDTGLSRNFVRHEVLPIIKKRWQCVSRVLARTTKHLAESQQLLDELAQIDFEGAQGSQLNTLSVSKLLALSKARQNNLLRFWIHRLGLILPAEIKLAQIQQEVLLARPDAKPLVHWQNVEVRRYHDDLYIMPTLLAHDATLVITWDGKRDLILPYDLGIIKVADILSLQNQSADASLSIRFRQGGEVCYIKNRGTRSLKKLMQEWGIPPWLRDRIPLIYRGEKLLMVYGYAVCA